jgi:hypothetical protein
MTSLAGTSAKAIDRSRDYTNQKTQTYLTRRDADEIDTE